MHHHVGQKQREGFAADQVSRAPHGMAEAERFLLAGEAHGARTGGLIGQFLDDVVLAATRQRVFEFILPVEVIFDHALVAAGHEDEMFDAGFTGLVDHQLNDRTIDDGQHLLGHRPGRRQEAGAEPGDGQDGLGDRGKHRRAS